MRYALAAEKEKPEAALFVKAQRQRDADWVKDIEELLKLETQVPTPSTAQKPTPAGTKPPAP
jgi:hypothetical protein